MAVRTFIEAIRETLFPGSVLKGRANLFVCPNPDAANIAYNLTRQMTEGVAIATCFTPDFLAFMHSRMKSANFVS